jgi:hypothetical protein
LGGLRGGADDRVGPRGWHCQAFARWHGTLVFGAGRRYLAWWMRGLGRPSPFFDPSSATLCEQHVLSLEERATLNG